VGTADTMRRLDVRALVDHVVRWNRLVPLLVERRTAPEMAYLFESDVLGDDPRAAWAGSAHAASAAFARDGAMERLVHHPLGDMPGAQCAFLRVFDNVVHAWDLARAISADETLDPELVQVLYEWVVPRRELIQASGAFGRPTDVPPDADRQTVLLALLGRRA
jgi:uncharacterized protein (TIGR03086 family)